MGTVIGMQESRNSDAFYKLREICLAYVVKCIEEGDNVHEPVDDLLKIWKQLPE